MRGGWQRTRARRRLGLAVCGVTLVALAGVLRLWWRDAATAGVLVSAIGAFVSVLALVGDFLRGDADTSSRSPEERRRAAADALADAVREQWAAEARLRRLRDPAPLEVRWTVADRRLADHPRNVRRARPLPAPRAGRLDDVTAEFAALPGRRMVVLGGPGSGKSVLAMRFVLARLAERSPGGAVPVIFPLAGWDPETTGLRDWLAERLALDYRPLAAPADERRTLARALLDAGLVLPVLDGFDELARPVYALAVRRVNAELDDDLPLLLTGRGEAWAAAVAEGDVLTGADVVELLPLSLSQAGAHLERTSRPRYPDGGRPVTVWTPVLRVLAERPELPAALALTSPLMVALARAVYGDDTSRDPAELLDEERLPTVEAVEGHLLEAFVPAAFLDAGPGAAPKAVRRLTLLARTLQERGRGRIGWWELDRLLPPAVRVFAPGLVSLAMLSALLVPVVLARAAAQLASVHDVVAVLATLAGQTLGFALGTVLLLPSARSRPRAFLTRQTVVTSGASMLLWIGVAWADDLRFGFRFGAVSDGWVPDLLGGCLFSLLFSLFFGLAGLPRRPVPAGLPWTGRAGRAVARVGGAALLVGGAGVTGAALLGRIPDPWTALLATTGAAAGGALLASGTRHGGGVPEGPRAGRLARRFAAGLVRGTAGALLVGVVACTAAGLAATGVTILKTRSAEDLSGRRIEGWRFSERHGVRSAVTSRPTRGTLLLPGDGARAVAYPEGSPPADCSLPLVRERSCVAFTSRRTLFEARDGAVVVRLVTAGAAGGETVAYAANLRSVLPERGRGWLTQGSVAGVVDRCLPPFLAAGVLIGVVGGCVCGVYRLLSVPSDLMRAAGPGSSLRTDRAASLSRGGCVALLVAVVCVPVVLLPGDWGGLVHLGTQLWLPLGTAALALSAWGRFVVARVWLAATGRLPWRLMGFLEDAHRRGVLRRSGASYEFRHLRLQNHLAQGLEGAGWHGGGGAPSGRGGAGGRVPAGRRPSVRERARAFGREDHRDPARDPRRPG
ncbi:NACHT domain-containing protein [Streptomyces sp. ACT015]|uniref:NACHT domain-containing protein n=1 Tax=Streptomyces sp. ACT015 TaxID=3134807 RepID=UPI003D178899